MITVSSKMRLGAHMSIAGGVGEALRRGASVGCRTVQIFTKNNTRWEGRRPTADEQREFLAARHRLGIEPVFAHTSYLINLAAPDPLIRTRSIRAMIDEVERCEELELAYLVVHPGSHGGDGEETGLRRVSEALREILAATTGAACRILLESTAGQGASLGWRFEQLRAMLDGAARSERTGVCLDTSHLFAAGYDLRTPGAYAATIDEFDRLVGLSNLFAWHLNDSKKGLGSRVDRHEHIGKGLLGREAFRHLLTDPRMAGLPGVLETPKNKDCDEDRMNLAVLRRLQSGRKRLAR
jgi:deoxyribonuclease-4